VKVTGNSSGPPWSVLYLTGATGAVTKMGTIQINIDPTTGLPIVGGDTLVTSVNSQPTTDQRVTQMTGEAPGSLNQQPGTDPNAPGDADPGLPYNFDQVPQTGPLNGSSS